jgi:hypothetical protein
MSLELVTLALVARMPLETPEIVPALPVTLTVSAWMPTPFEPVAEMVHHC